MSSLAEELRISLSQQIGNDRKAHYGQYFTPVSIAEFMTGLFTRRDEPKCRLLDAGAGVGSLSSAFLKSCALKEFRFDYIHLDAFEIDSNLGDSLRSVLGSLGGEINFDLNIRMEDFVQVAARTLTGDLFADALKPYTHAILNPPYQKIRSASSCRSTIRRAGIETVNLYAAFTALSLSLLDEKGQLVAILPRSFCNGPYYRQFREFIFERSALRHIHLFDSRSRAFKDDNVLQENVIVFLDRGTRQGRVVISSSTDQTLSDTKERSHPFEEIVVPGDSELVIHIPPSIEICPQGTLDFASCSLSDLAIEVSTGPVVDFRVKEYLRHTMTAHAAPLVYPSHLKDGKSIWPKSARNKPSAIGISSDTKKLLYPAGHYCLVRRFSSKEEPRRIVASTIDPDDFGNQALVGIENHLNIFHDNKGGLPRPLAHGLKVYLNSTAVDEKFRSFSGHTQVNATDLRLLKYPSKRILTQLGKWAQSFTSLTQSSIDQKIGSLGL